MTPPPPKEYKTCLGDLYSISWLEDSDVEDLSTETLEEQYLNDSKHYTYEGSHVMQYGTQRISNETVSVYQGACPMNHTANPSPSFDSMGVVDPKRSRSSFHVAYVQGMDRRTTTKGGITERNKEITIHRTLLDSSMITINAQLLGDTQHGSQRGSGLPLVDDWDCLKSMVRTFETHCGSLTQYGMKHTRTFANACNNGV
ncbi:putative legumain protein [Helianthus annuus]|nr:putative legumain protein [Helianthus annuus]